MSHFVRWDCDAFAFLAFHECRVLNAGASPATPQPVRFEPQPQPQPHDRHHDRHHDRPV